MLSGAIFASTGSAVASMLSRMGDERDDMLPWRPGRRIALVLSVISLGSGGLTMTSPVVISSACSTVDISCRIPELSRPSKTLWTLLRSFGVEGRDLGEYKILSGSFNFGGRPLPLFGTERSETIELNKGGRNKMAYRFAPPPPMAHEVFSSSARRVFQWGNHAC